MLSMLVIILAIKSNSVPFAFSFIAPNATCWYSICLLVVAVTLVSSGFQSKLSVTSVCDSLGFLDFLFHPSVACSLEFFVCF